ncbi:MAG: hypothetical protein J6U43_06470, partial [Bacteroidales bacterium]|nr:hypothetical protein [Bacteroidales bacterium]
ELLMGGTLTIGGTDYLQKKANNLGMDFSLPGIHFAKMRIANCKRWTSKYDFVKNMQNGKDNADILYSFYKNKDHEVAKNFWFSTGDWSLASLPNNGGKKNKAYMPYEGDTYFAHGPSEYEPQMPNNESKDAPSQTLGPFTFTLKDYSFDFKDSQLTVGLEGQVKFIDEIELAASAGITIKAELTGVSEAMKMDFSKLDFNYTETTFDKAEVDASFAGMTLEGLLSVSNDKKKKGYSGTLKFTMPGELFVVDALGGYYEEPEFNWGYFQIKLGSSTGLRVDPIVINNIEGGFYFNCIRKNESTAQPKEGVIGVVAGIGLSTSAGEDALSGDFDMTVIYDRKNDCLSTFVFTGKLKAVSGLVNSKASLVYECDNMQEYFALNVTVDAKLDPTEAEMAKKLKNEMTTISSKLKELNSKAEGLVADVKGGLSAFAGNSENKASKGKREGSNVDVKKKTAEAKTKAQSEFEMKVGSATVSLDLRITMKEAGKDLDKVKWHLCIGQPDENKRCTFTLIDFRSPIVSVNIGANAYLCLGNELPGNGELPPIPDKVKQFLNGSTAGEGVKSDDINMANRGRTRALEEFKSDVNGGLLLGASVWGYVDVDLGLFFGEMGAIGGFDLALTKLSGMPCMNLGTTPGYNGWYGEGQLYAYLYAVFGLKLDLGFWEGEFEVLNAGIGGVMRMGGINPNYFTGAARVKLRAFNGLVDLNRKFEFECGDVCDMFYGNALDDFELFGNCSIGDTIKDNGWNEENKINPELSNKIIVETLAPLNEHFRVLDPTELARIERDIDADKAQLEALASRTFTFKMSIPYAQIYEYDSPEDKSPIVYQVSYDEQKS